MVIGASTSVFAKLLAEGRPQKYKRGDFILYQGEVPRSALYISNGVVKAYDIGNNGDEKTVSLLTRGEFVAPAWVFNKAPVSLYYYAAFTDCELIHVYRSDIAEALANDKAALKEMFDKYLSLYVGATLQINVLEQSKGIDKILYILQYLMMRFGASGDGNTKTIRLRLTHQDLANLTGLTRETTSVELSKLRDKGVISYEDQHYTVNTAKLMAMLSSDEFTSFKY